MPLPPPPAAALMRTGKPIARAVAAQLVLGVDHVAVVPGTTGTPAAIAARALILSPISRIAWRAGR
jgi:1-aminocyclopropane-1-carboxylate deaminase/D-cysteine desulfhydrase-like pyridoxal-dependent ACC family enzyme